jgi:hypothetical protein
VTVGVVAGTRTSGVTFDAAIASYADIYNLVATGATSVTVTGLNFCV